MQEMVEQDRPVIRIRPLRMVRVTCWETKCLKCGGRSVSRNKKSAQRDAVGHARAQHGGMATINEVKR